MQEIFKENNLHSDEAGAAPLALHQSVLILTIMVSDIICQETCNNRITAMFKLDSLYATSLITMSMS